jgi:hypothetical protein
MTDHSPTGPDEPDPALPTSSSGPEPSVAGDPGSADAAPPPHPPSTPDAPAEMTGADHARRGRDWSWLSSRRTGWVVAAALVCAVIGLSIALAVSPSATATQPAAGSSSSGAPAVGGPGSNARSGPAAGGAAGTVVSVSATTYTMTTAAGQEVTVDEASGTTYRDNTGPTSGGAVTTGADVLVLGTANGTTISATQLLVQPAGSDGSAASAAAGVIPFQSGSPTTSKQVGKVPADYTEGSGTIVSGTAANTATQAALAAYPGGVVDRVVQLSTGEYEVHYIGVNWPHHIFVDQDFTVVGAE